MRKHMELHFFILDYRFFVALVGFVDITGLKIIPSRKRTYQN